MATKQMEKYPAIPVVTEEAMALPRFCNGENSAEAITEAFARAQQQARDLDAFVRELDRENPVLLHAVEVCAKSVLAALAMMSDFPGEPSEKVERVEHIMVAAFATVLVTLNRQDELNKKG